LKSRITVSFHFLDSFPSLFVFGCVSMPWKVSAH